MPRNNTFAFGKFRTLVAAACALLLAPTFAQAQLSTSEQAALAERPATPAERTRKEVACTIAPTTVGTFDITPDLTADLIQLPAMTFLKSVEVAYQGPEAGSFDPIAYNDVANGGIANFDFCNRVDIMTFIKPTVKGDIVKIVTLRLRSGLDLGADYPNTSVELFDRELIITNGMHTYAVVNLSDPATRQWYDRSAGSWANENGITQGLLFGDTLAIRMPE